MMRADVILLNVANPNRPRRRATYEDVLQAPEHLVAEIIDGELYTSPRPAPRHAVAAYALGGQLFPLQKRKDDPAGWWIVPEPELHFRLDTPDREVLVPDLAAWRRERMPAFPTTAYFTLSPDWICEVLSPSTARIDRTKKLDIYAREGVHFAWIVDPRLETLEVLVRVGARWMIHATHQGQDTVRAVPFDSTDIELASLWIETETSSAEP